MIKSIRATLFIYLSISAIVIGILISLTSNYYFNRKDIRQHLDSVLAITGLSLSAAFQKNSIDDIKLIQENLNQVPELFESIHETHFSTREYQKQYKIQIFDKTGKQIMHSTDAPVFQNPIILKPGFQNIETWRIFVTYNQQNDFYIVVSEKFTKRSEIIRKIILKDLSLLLLIIPVIGLLLWSLIYKSLKPLNLVIKQVSQRNPTHLKPLNILNTPQEINPLILEINQLLKRLKEGLSREQQFAGDAAHEIRTPLAIIKTLAQNAMDSKNLDEINQNLIKIIQNVDRGSHVIQQLMSMSKTMPEIQKKSSFKTLNLVDLVGHSLAQLVPQALERQIEIEFEADLNCPKIKGNATAIDILIRNLIDNSIRYSYENSHIYVHVYGMQDKVVLEIRDEGPGIPKAKKEKVFERFYRIDNLTPFHGTGLGLAIVKQIANLHQAQISLESPIEGTGVIFRVFFPSHKH
jgi:two-component system sensor histidine kinase QseC